MAPHPTVNVTPPSEPPPKAHTLASFKSKGEYSPQMKDTLAGLCAMYGMSGESTGPGLSFALTSLLGGEPIPESEIASRDTVFRAVCIAAECLDDELVERIVSWEHRTIGLDKTTIYSDRHFLEVHFIGRTKEGKYETKIWEYHELNTGQDTLEMLKDMLAAINARQRVLGVPETRAYQWNAMSIDNAADGKGEKNGLAVRFDRFRRAEFDKYPFFTFFCFFSFFYFF